MYIKSLNAQAKKTVFGNNPKYVLNMTEIHKQQFILYLKRDCKFKSRCYLLIGLVSLHYAEWGVTKTTTVSSKTYTQGNDVHFHSLMLDVVYVWFQLWIFRSPSVFIWEIHFYISLVLSTMLYSLYLCWFKVILQ